MIVGNFYGADAARIPDKTDAILAVNADAVLPAPVAAQGFQPISRRIAQLVQVVGRVKSIQQVGGQGMELPGTGTPGGGAVDAVENICCPLVGKIRNHPDILALMAGRCQPVRAGSGFPG